VLEAPTYKLILRTLGSALRNQRRFDESIVFYDRAAALPGGDPVAMFNKHQSLHGLKRYPEAEAVIDRALALAPAGYLYRAKASFLLLHHGKLDEAAAMLTKVPPAYLLEDTGAYLAFQVWYWRREPDKALAVITAVPREIGEGDFTGPMAMMTGMAHEMAGRKEAARSEWRAALRIVEQQLAAQPNSVRWFYWQARVLASLDQVPEAERVVRIFEELTRNPGITDEKIPLYLKLGRSSEVFTSLETRVDTIEAARDVGEAALVRNYLRFDPQLDAVRDHPRFQAIQARLDAQASSEPAARK
jgi:tetratricopeptide (TPR) repeat protein